MRTVSLADLGPVHVRPTQARIARAWVVEQLRALPDGELLTIRCDEVSMMSRSYARAAFATILEAVEAGDYGGRSVAFSLEADNPEVQDALSALSVAPTASRRVVRQATLSDAGVGE